MVILPLEVFAGSFDSAPKGIHTSDYYLSRIKKEQLDPIEAGAQEEEAFAKGLKNIEASSTTPTAGWIPYTLR